MFATGNGSDRHYKNIIFELYGSNDDNSYHKITDITPTEITGQYYNSEYFDVNYKYYKVEVNSTLATYDGVFFYLYGRS